MSEPRLFPNIAYTSLLPYSKKARAEADNDFAFFITYDNFIFINGIS